MQMMLDKKQIRVIIQVQNGSYSNGDNLPHQQCPGTAKGRTLQWWFKMFAKEMGALKLRCAVAAIRGWQWLNWEQSSELILLQLHETLPKNSAPAILWSFGILSKLERWKTLINGCIIIWLKIKKIVIWKCHLLLCCATAMNHFLIRLWCVMKSGFYVTTGNSQLSGWTEKKLQSTSQSPTCTKKSHGHCLVLCCCSGPLQLSQSWPNHYIWEVCSANWWDELKTAPAASTGQQNGPSSSQQCPTACHITSASKVEWIGLQSFASYATFTRPLVNRLPIL